MRYIVALLLLLLSSVPGARAQLNPDIGGDTAKWYNRVHQLGEVTVRSKRSKYSRKDNPAVELMKKVIAAKKRTRLENHDYYQYNKYQKLTLAVNDITPGQMQEGLFSKQWLLNQIEPCPYNNKLILPVSVNETVTQRIYRKEPRAKKDIIKGERSGGINRLFQTGDILDAVLKDFFTDVDIYDDQIRLLQHPFTSPIGKDAIRFYRFYIVDTLNVASDRCIQVRFLPNNQQDFGFCGDIYILGDSSYQVKRCEMAIPKRSDVNFIDGMKIQQEFTKIPTGEWVLTTDDMLAELQLYDFLTKAVVIRNTRIGDHAFGTIPKQLFKGKESLVTDAGAKQRDEDFWGHYRQVGLTRGERGMDDFVKGIKQQGGFRYVMMGLKLLAENFVETGTETRPSKVDIGPVNTFVSSNFIDGLRMRLGAQTTANLHPHLFFKGYYAHGWKSKKDYYKGELVYSFNRKDYLPAEYPVRNITFTSAYDVCAPTDKFMSTDKDNVFTALKWTKVDKMMFYNRQQLKLEREEGWGLRSTLTVTAEEDEACGGWESPPSASSLPPFTKIRTTELRAEWRYAPGEKFVNTKQRRRPVNLDAPVFTLSHAVGFDGFLGGQYSYNFTEASVFKRFWVKSWGKVDVSAKAGAQWSRVPFPLLIMPAANLSYVLQNGTFSLINNMEFLNDRYASLDLRWDLNGKLFNRLPLVRELKWREYIGVKTLWGKLTDKNNPALGENAGSGVLMRFPEGSHIMDPHKAYVEIHAGVHNVFRFFHIEYVRRLTYLEFPTAHKQGVRINFSIKF